MIYTDDQIKDLWHDYRVEYRNWGADGLTARRKMVLDGKAQLEGYTRRPKTQDDELVRLDAELMVLDTLIGEREVVARNEKIAQRAAQIERATALMSDPSNVESGSDPGPGCTVGGQSPALVKGLGDRPESAAEIIQRAGNPWAARSAPLDGHTSYGRQTPAPG
jgi:hypothetical protein